jgi:hypothetical protein
MNASPLTAIYNSWTRPSYERRVRGTTLPFIYLWGSAGIEQDVAFDKPLILHIRNDLFGEPVTLYTQTVAQVASNAQTIVGTLGRGECVSIRVQNMCGVYATCVLESTVACLIREQA